MDSPIGDKCVVRANDLEAAHRRRVQAFILDVLPCIPEAARPSRRKDFDGEYAVSMVTSEWSLRCLDRVSSRRLREAEGESGTPVFMLDPSRAGVSAQPLFFYCFMVTMVTGDCG